MRKKPDMYLEQDSWKIIENQFHKDRSRVSESLFSLSNEYMGIRGYFEEGYSGDTLPGLYLNGVYEEYFTENPGYKGISNRLCFMVNTVDWLYIRINIDGEQLDLAKVIFSDFKRELDFKTGELKREFIWTTSSEKKTHCLFRRLVDMKNPEYCFQSISFVPDNWSGDIEIITGIDWSLEHEAFKDNFWICKNVAEDQKLTGATLKTENTHIHLFAGYTYSVSDTVSAKQIIKDSFAASSFTLKVEEKKESKIEKLITIYFSKTASPEEVESGGFALLKKQKSINYNNAYKKNREYWAKILETTDIEIKGDPVNQQGIRFCIFQLQQTYTGKMPGANIGAKGLTGEAYNGNTFWDTETYCLPYYLFTNPDAAKSLLIYRYNTLNAARKRAIDLDYKGACYPVATIDGSESCTLWQHASLQFQSGTAVAYAIEHYVKITEDEEFLFTYGLEMLIEICRFLASRVQYSKRKKTYGYYGVMGPDEYHLMVNNNCYTNYLAKTTLDYTLKTFKSLNGTSGKRIKKLKKKLNLSNTEQDKWKSITQNMYIPYTKDSLIFEQHDGFFDLPHINIHDIPIDDFPLYHNWSYDRIYRTDMIKQPDVLMFIFLFNQSFSKAQKIANYEPLCIHESSLSPSVHSILALELEKHEEGLDFFRFATRIDLDNYNRNTREGLHMTAIAAAWMNIVYGYAGLRSDGPIISLNPVLPETWDSLSIQIKIKDSYLGITISAQTTEIKVKSGNPVTVLLRGVKTVIDNTGVIVSTKVAGKNKVSP